MNTPRNLLMSKLSVNAKYQHKYQRERKKLLIQLKALKK